MQRWIYCAWMSMAWFAVVAFCLPSAAAMQPASPIPTAAAPEKLGMVIRDPWYEFGTNPTYPNQPNYAAQERMGVVLAEMGVEWVRLEFLIEGSDVVSTTQVARNDYFINVVAPRYNLKVLGLLGFGLMRDYPPNAPDDPRALNYPTTTADPVYGGGTNEYMRTWLNRARMVADRYQGRVAAYEILNEQNRLPPNGDAVPAEIAARLHTKFYRFFRHVDSDTQLVDQSWRDDVQIILGGLHPAGTREVGGKGYISDRDYLRQLYKSDGFQSYHDVYGAFPLDGLGYHPYPEEIRVSLQTSLDLINARMQNLRGVLAELGDPVVPFWVTEIGYNIGYRRQTQTGQAQFLREIYTTLTARGDVATVFWFKYEDFPPMSGPNAQLWGVVRVPFTVDQRCPGGACYALDGNPVERRPAYWVYRELAGLPVEHVHVPLLGNQR